MGSVDSGVWKLLMYAVIGIILMGVLFILVIQPFIDGGTLVEKNPNIIVDALVNTATYGLPINYSFGAFEFCIAGVCASFNGFNLGDINVIYKYLVPQSIKDSLVNSTTSLYYLPEWIQTPITIIILFAFIISIYVLATMLIP